MEIIKSSEIIDLKELSNLVLNSFNKYVAPDYSQEGQNSFYGFFSEGKMLEKTLENGDFIFLAKEDNKTVGILTTRGKTHISLLFVDENYHGKGIAKKLFNTLLEDTEPKKITVNSSPFAEKIYEKLGFCKTSEMQEKDGIKSVPMVFEK